MFEEYASIPASASALEVIMEVVENHGERFVITRHGKPCAVLMPYDDWRLWQDRIEATLPSADDVRGILKDAGGEKG